MGPTDDSTAQLAILHLQAIVVLVGLAVFNAFATIGADWVRTVARPDPHPHLSPLTLPLTSHLSPLTSHPPPHISPLTSHLSPSPLTLTLHPHPEGDGGSRRRRRATKKAQSSSPAMLYVHDVPAKEGGS